MFVIDCIPKFTEQVLPKLFKHCKFPSFVRQLNVRQNGQKKKRTRRHRFILFCLEVYPFCWLLEREKGRAKGGGLTGRVQRLHPKKKGGGKKREEGGGSIDDRALMNDDDGPIFFFFRLR
ncbi:hypothetical protein BC940DRAFT_176605 [Gongronella butleri]|nr:hypothetical protein BC940DRAFT_176605 [Gongronella butleri]